VRDEPAVLPVEFGLTLGESAKLALESFLSHRARLPALRPIHSWRL
jgi:hypothetical protein